MTAKGRLGVRGFFVGELSSQLGRELTWFAIAVTFFRETGSVTRYALLTMCSELPIALFASWGGALVDRFGARPVLQLCNVVGGALSVLLAMAFASHRASPEMLYVAATILALNKASRAPATVASLVGLVGSGSFRRTHGAYSMGQGLTIVIVPLLGSKLIAATSPAFALSCDVVTYAVSAAILMFVRFGHRSEEAATSRRSLAQGLKAFAWLRQREGLLSALLLFSTISVLQGFVMVLVQPFALRRGDLAFLGILQTAAGVGYMAGSVLVAVGLAPKRNVVGLFVASLVLSVALGVTGTSSSRFLLACGAFVITMTFPFSLSCMQALFQSQAPPEVRGRAAALPVIVGTACGVLAYVMAGPLVDRVFEPPADHAVPWLASLVGVGPGRGIGFLFAALGVIALVVTSAFMTRRSLWRLESSPSLAPSS